MQMSGNTILITGGGSGIGRGLAEAFHALGNKVIIAGRRRAALDAVTAANPGMAAAELDIENPKSIRDFTERLAGEHPTLNAVVNNAGIMRPENLRTPPIDLADAEAMITTNLLGPMRLTGALLPQLLKQPQATVMTVTSGLAFLPLAITPTYCATKAAIHAWTQSLRYQLKDTQVQVIELTPPYVQTELMGPPQASDPRAMPLKEFIAEAMAILKSWPEVHEVLVERVKPLRYAEAGESYEATFAQFNDAMPAPH